MSAEHTTSGADAPTPLPSPNRSAMFIAFLVTAIDLLGFGIVLPLMPRLAGRYIADDDPYKGAIIGLLYSVFSVMQFVFTPMWGRVSDRVGRKPILLLSLVGSVVFYGLFGYASMLPTEQATWALLLILLSRIGAGIAGASVSTAAAVIADCTTPERRAKGMALIGAAFGVGFTIGPLIAWAGEQVFAGAPWGPGAMASVVSGIALILAAVMFRETLPPGPKPPREFFSLRRTMEVLRTPAVGPLVLVYFLAIFAFANFEGTVALFTQSAFGLTDEDNYLAFAFIGFVLMIAQGGVYRPLATRRPEEYLLKLGIGMMVIGLGGLAAVAFAAYLLRASPDAVHGLNVYFYLSITVAVFGFAFVNPSVSALVSRRADPRRQGEVLGVNQSFAALGRILGPFVGSYVFFQQDSRVLPFVVATGTMLFVIGLLPAIRTTEDTRKMP